MNGSRWVQFPLVGQVRAEQPTTVHDQFTRTILQEIARCLNMPFNVAAGNSAGYNFASGRLDHQSFYKAIRIDQTFMAETVLDRVLGAWLDEAVLVEGYLPQQLRVTGVADQVTSQREWFWDGLEHVDPAKEAGATATKLASNTSNLAIEYAKQGLDWQAELRQRAKEKALMRELGLSEEEAAPSPSAEQETEAEELAEEIRAHG